MKRSLRIAVLALLADFSGILFRLCLQGVGGIRRICGHLCGFL